MAHKVVKPETKLATFQPGAIEPNLARLVQGDREAFAQLVMFYNEFLYR